MYLPVQVVLDQPVRRPVRHPDVIVLRDDVGQNRRVVAGRPHLQELAVLVEDLHAVVLAIGDEEPPVAADPDAVHGPELVRTRLVRIDGRPSPVHQELSVAVEFRDARAGVPVGDEERAVRQPGDVGRPIEVVRAASGHTPLADRLHQLAVVREDVDRSAWSSSTIQMCFWRSYGLISSLCGPRPTSPSPEPRGGARYLSCCSHSSIVLPFAIHREDEVVTSHLVGVASPGIGAPARIRAAGGEQARADPRRGARRQLNLAALRDPDFVRTLGQHAGARAPGPPGVRKIGVGQRPGPVLHDLVVAHGDLLHGHLDLGLGLGLRRSAPDTAGAAERRQQPHRQHDADAADSERARHTPY